LEKTTCETKDEKRVGRQAEKKILLLGIHETLLRGHGTLGGAKGPGQNM